MDLGECSTERPMLVPGMGALQRLAASQDIPVAFAACADQDESAFIHRLSR